MHKLKMVLLHWISTIKYIIILRKKISEHVINTLVLSLTEQPGIEGVAVTVNGKADLVDEEGKKLTEPVTRPEK